MSARDDKIRQVVAELDVHVAEVEASIAVLKALLAEDEVPGDEDPVNPEATLEGSVQTRGCSVLFAPSLAYKGGASGYAAWCIPAAFGRRRGGSGRPGRLWAGSGAGLSGERPASLRTVTGARWASRSAGTPPGHRPRWGSRGSLRSVLLTGTPSRESAYRCSPDASSSLCK